MGSLQKSLYLPTARKRVPKKLMPHYLQHHHALVQKEVERLPVVLQQRPQPGGYVPRASLAAHLLVVAEADVERPPRPLSAAEHDLQRLQDPHEALLVIYRPAAHHVLSSILLYHGFSQERFMVPAAFTMFMFISRHSCLGKDSDNFDSDNNCNISTLREYKVYFTSCVGAAEDTWAVLLEPRPGGR